MMYLYWKNLELYEANSLQYALVKGLISPLTLLGWACNLKHQLVSKKAISISVSAAMVIYSCKAQQDRSIYRSYIPGDSHLLKSRITTTFRQNMTIDLILGVDSDHDEALTELINSSEAQYLFHNMTLAKSRCFSAKNSRPCLFTDLQELYKELLNRPVHGFLPVSYSDQQEIEGASKNSHHDPLDTFLTLLCESREYENIHGISSLFPMVMGLRLLGPPCHRHRARNNYPHTFAEPLLGLATPLYLYRLTPYELANAFWKHHWEGYDYLAINDTHNH